MLMLQNQRLVIAYENTSLLAFGGDRSMGPLIEPDSVLALRFPPVPYHPGQGPRREKGARFNRLTEGFRVQSRLSRELVSDHFPISTHIWREQLEARILGTGLKAARAVSPVGNFKQN